jgi:hypothetical protein
MAFNRRNAPYLIEPTGVGAADRRAEALRLEQERAEERKQRLAGQVSPLNSPEDRIRIWEQLHGLNLPRSTTHNLLRVIAAQTALTLQQVRDEQQRRASRTG